MQLPPYVVSGPSQRDELGRILARLKPARAAVEFRHRSWAADGERQAAAELLGEHDAAWVVRGRPAHRRGQTRCRPSSRSRARRSPTCACTGATSTWTKGRTVAERFDHVYTDDEMEEWLDPVLDMAERAQEVAVVFNNNARDYALRNATRFTELLQGLK